MLPLENIDGFLSPRLGVRFEQNNEGLRLLVPNGRPFLTREERVEEFVEERIRILAERDQEQARLAELEQLAEAQRAQLEAMRAKLRAMGIDPEQLT